MTAKWEYLFEFHPFVAQHGWVEGFNEYLNTRASEGWALESVQYQHDNYSRWANVIWRR
jgi:hypothetical protein